MVRDLSKSLRDLNLHYLALLQSEQRVAADALAGSWAFLYGMAVAMLLPGLAIGILIARRFARPVTDLAKQANEAIEESIRPELDLLHPVDTLRSSVKALQDRISALKTELEQGRDRMAQSERLAVVGRVAASLTHEITRPLATVKFLLETGSQSQDVAPADYQRALRDVERIETLLEEFLDFAGAHKPRFALVDVNAIVSDALQFIAGECEQRKMAVEREMGDCPHILGDETMLREAVVNIMLNALEAMSSGGTLSITTRLTLAGGPPPSDAEGVEVFFSDEGPGFSERDLERIFEPFYSTKPKGTGMGMTIVKRAVDLHGGSLRLLNREEGGAIVITFLPLPTPEQQQVLERLEAQLTPRRLPSIA
jgi:signal transduction histidine kinase